MDENRTEPLLPPPPPRQGPPVPPGRADWAAEEPFYRRHGLAFAISTAVLAIILLLGMVALGTFAVTSVLARAAHNISQAQPDRPGHDGGQGGPGAPGGPGDGKGGLRQGKAVVRGTIDSQSAASWTITTQNGATVKVTITGKTIFGVPASQGSASDFARGDEVIVLGKRSDNTMTASRIVKASAVEGRSPSTPRPTPSATATPGG